MRVLIACECSGVVRSAFRARGHDAWSCDLKPAEDAQDFHIKGNVLDALDDFTWDLMIAHPPCTYLSVSGLHWNKRRPEREALTTEAVVFAALLMAADVAHIAIENPVGCLSTRLRKPDQIFQPYQFGDDASKKTCLWLSNLPRLTADQKARFSGRIVTHKGKTVERWSNQTDSGQNKLAPSPTRAAQRAVTYAGVAKAMAEQWGNL